MESIIHDPLNSGNSSIPTCNWDQRLSVGAHRVLAALSSTSSHISYLLPTLLRVYARVHRAVVFFAPEIKARRHQSVMIPPD